MKLISMQFIYYDNYAFSQARSKNQVIPPKLDSLTHKLSLPQPLIPLESLGTILHTYIAKNIVVFESSKSNNRLQNHKTVLKTYEVAVTVSYSSPPSTVLVSSFLNVSTGTCVTSV